MREATLVVSAVHTHIGNISQPESCTLHFMPVQNTWHAQTGFKGCKAANHSTEDASSQRQHVESLR